MNKLEGSNGLAICRERNSRPCALVGRKGLEVIWPLKRRVVPRPEIASVRAMDKEALRREIGSGIRIGAGGLWGAFGWLRTTRRGTVQMCITRTDDFVWIERVGDKPWLITPEEPEAFVRALSPEGR